MPNWFQGILDGGQQQEEEDVCASLQLTKTQRMYGFGICFGLGCLLSLLSTLMLIGMNLVGFAVIYSIGNILSIMSTGFLVGPMRQFKNMFDPTRIVATCIFLGTLVATLLVALLAPKPFNLFAIILVLIQFGALVWYCASYIPFARDGIRNCMGSMCG